MERSEGPLETWVALGDAVRTELTRSGVALGKPDRVDDVVELPVLNCGEIRHAPAVRAAMTRARETLAPFYRAR